MNTYHTFYFALLVVLASASSLTPVETDDVHGGGSEPDKGKIRLKATLSKVFIGDAVTLTVDLTAPEYKDENDQIHDMSIDNIPINFSHVTRSVQYPTDSRGKAIVEWDATMPADTEPGDNGEVEVSASIPSNLQGDYQPWEDVQKVTVVAGDVALTVHLINDDGSTGEEVDQVTTFTSVRLRARLRDNSTGEVRFFSEWQSEDGPWPELPPVDHWNRAAVNDDEAIFDITLLGAGKHRFHADYLGKRDKALCRATLPPSFKVVSYVQPVRVEYDTIFNLFDKRDLPETYAQYLLVDKILEAISASANTVPPASFTDESWNHFVGSKEYRGYLIAQPRATCFRPQGTIKQVDLLDSGASQGYTPMRSSDDGPTVLYEAGVGESSNSTGALGAPCVQFVAENKFMVSELGQFGWQLAFGQGPPFAWHRIEIKVCCDNDNKATFSGSRFPSHKSYEDNAQESSHGGSTESNFMSFIESPANTLAEGTSF